VSGFSVPKKQLQKANDLIGSTPKPDRITEGQKGWNLEPQKDVFKARPCLCNRATGEFKPSPKAD
jgi:hypothetical protein